MLGFVGVTEAADAAAKAAAVELAAVEKIDGGIISIRLLGDVGAVQAAVDAGVQAAQQVGTLVAHHVIPNPHDDLVRVFGLTQETEDKTALENLSVRRLRQIARDSPQTSLPFRSSRGRLSSPGFGTTCVREAVLTSMSPGTGCRCPIWT